MSRLIALVLAVVLTGCAQVRVHRYSVETRETRRKAFTSRTLAWGVIPITDPINLNAECPEGWKTVSSEIHPVQGLLRFLTLNFYQAWSVGVVCNDPPPPKRVEDD